MEQEADFFGDITGLITFSCLDILFFRNYFDLANTLYSIKKMPNRTFIMNTEHHFFPDVAQVIFKLTRKRGIYMLIILIFVFELVIF